MTIPAKLRTRLESLEAVAKKGKVIVLVVLGDLAHGGRTWISFDDRTTLVGEQADKELERAKRDGRLQPGQVTVLVNVNSRVALGQERHPDERMAMEEATDGAARTGDEHHHPTAVDVPADEVGDVAGQEEAPDEGEDALAEDLEEVARAIEAGGPVEVPQPPPEPTRTIQWLDWP